MRTLFATFKPFFLSLIILLLGSGHAIAQLKTVVHLKQNYVYASEISRYYKEYNFKRIPKGGNAIRLEAANKMTVIDFVVNSQEVFINNVKFHFSYPVAYKNGDFLVSQVDFSKLIHPILRYSNINRNRSFTTVIIDPGHGGKDPGTVNRYGQEKKYTLSLAKKLESRLRKKGFQVKLTRTGDTYPSLQDRVNFANQYQDAIFISLHFNAGGAGRAWGIETFSLSPPGVAHYGRGLKKSDFQVRTGNNQDSANIALATAIHGRTTRKLDARDRGIRRARYTVLTGVRHPAVLFEGGFMSHYKEAVKINNDGYLDLMADAMVSGIVSYKVATEKNRR